MEQQKKMEESFLRAHREFMTNLNASLDILEKDIDEVGEMAQICTDEWCKATENVLDELAKVVYSISEPRWLSDEDSLKLKCLRERIHNLYGKYKKTSTASA
ncbi:MAG: hypothetical protein RBR09_12750 [Desulfobulbaceae bacterium]|jgi:hypothetical protein|nr:hypothetical protein [Desulfobulbaceae bacterium]MDY0352118.1 hypothetical protein [Desulfobulbaceae bacterium]